MLERLKMSGAQVERIDPWAGEGAADAAIDLGTLEEQNG